MTKRSPINDRHEALGAKLADFGGWLMPIEYPGDGGGVLAEHAAVRDAVGLFDVSHLGKAGVRGPGARDFVNRCLTNDLARIGPGQAQYTFCCADDGGVIDDLIAYLVSEDEVFLVPNAANTAAVVARLIAAASAASVTVTNEHEQFGVLAVQGPAAPAVLAALGLPSDLPYMGYADAEFAGGLVRVCRTGYTGELGYELIPAWARTGVLWDAALAAVRAEGGRPAGLGARDTLRTEMGYPLHGQDLSPMITPVQARAGWAVGWDKPEFWGRAALVAERAAGPARALWGIESLERGIPRPHMAVLAGTTGEAGDAAPIGEVTSGTFSPTLKRGIGLALLDSAAGVNAGDQAVLDVRGRRYPVRVVKPPFVPSHVR